MTACVLKQDPNKSPVCQQAMQAMFLLSDSGGSDSPAGTFHVLQKKIQPKI